jgi:hypothetical protein
MGKCGSSGKHLALQAQSPEFKPQSHEKQQQQQQQQKSYWDTGSSL